MAEPGIVEVFHDRHEEARSSFALGVIGLAMNADPGLDERTDEPGPDGSLVVNSVSFAYSSFVASRVSGLFGGKGTQAHRGQEPRFDSLNHFPRSFPLE